MANFKSVDEYVVSQPQAVQGLLGRVRSTIGKALPGERIAKFRAKEVADRAEEAVAVRGRSPKYRLLTNE